jgi:glycosyltransferase involved in cell wall biosynthesis
LEIIVVDDGSSDRTSEIAQQHAVSDARVRLIWQKNAGVAAARNRGIAESTGEYIAPLDADDLWKPDKLSRQLQRFEEAGSQCGLVYTWFALIDENGRILMQDTRSKAEGRVLEAMCERNIVGNGSSPLILRAAIEAVGGYDTHLREVGAQGCEDYKLYFRIAEEFDFALVPDILTGYRATNGSMSRNYWQMVRSREICAADISARHPQYTKRLRSGRTRLLRFKFTGALRAGHFKLARQLLVELIKSDPLRGSAHLLDLGRRLLHRPAGHISRRQPFLDAVGK